MIIPRGKKRIGLFKEALDRYEIPCEVTGGNAFLGIDQLSVLIDCLRAVNDPHHGVHYLAILRDRLFAFSDVELFERANAWRQGQRVREYLDAACSEYAPPDGGVPLDSRLAEYLRWGFDQADRLDPLRESPHSVPDTSY